MTHRKAMLFWLLAVSFFFYEFFIRVSPSVFVFDLSQSFQITPGAVGQLTALYFYTYIIMQLPAGLLIDRYGERNMLVLAAVLLAAGNVWFAHSTNLLMAQVSRLFMGIGASFCMIGALKVIAKYFPVEKRGLFVGLTATMGVLGAVAGQNILPFTLESLGWRYDVYFFAMVGIVFAIAFWVLYPKHRYVRQAHVISKGALKQINTPNTWLLALYAGLVNAPTVAFASMWGVPYLVKGYHMPTFEAAEIVSLVWVGQIFGSAMIGWVCDRYPLRRIMLIGAIGSIISIGVIIYPYNTNLWLLMVTMFLLGGFCSFNFVPFAAMSKQMPVALNGLASGLISTVNIAMGTILQVIMSVLVGNVLSHHAAKFVFDKSSLLLPVVMVPVFLVLGLMVALLIKFRKPVTVGV